MATGSLMPGLTVEHALVSLVILVHVRGLPPDPYHPRHGNLSALEVFARAESR